MEGANQLDFCTAMFSKLPAVKLTDQGTFKYILIDVKSKKTGETCRFVRGDEMHHYHADNFAAFGKELDSAEIVFQGDKLISGKTVSVSCPGGGRVVHDKAAKSLSIYGYSQSYGQADHNITAAIVKEHLKYTNVQVSFEGY